MEKKNHHHGLIVGKFMPPHRGHLHLVNSALWDADRVTVLVCTLGSEPIPGDLRYGWVKEIYAREPMVEVIHFHEEVPQYPEDSPDFWDIWVEIARRYCPDLDVVFTSENYGDEYARRLGVAHNLVDRDRKTFPVSGTAVRACPYTHWDYIPEIVKSYFLRRVVLMGPESCGKTTLCERLARHYNTTWTEEYGRTYCDEHGGNLDAEDFVRIAKGREEIERQRMTEARGVLFCDTEEVTTHVYVEMYCPGRGHLVDQWFEDRITSRTEYDLTVLLSPDCEAVQDGTRIFLDKRWEHFVILDGTLRRRGVIPLVVGGSWEERFKRIVDEVDRILGIYR